MASVSTILGAIHVEDEGDSTQPTALLWPSLFSDHTSWASQVKALRAAGWRTLAIDPPGQGASPGPGRGFTMDECTRVAIEVLDAMGIGKPVLFLGTSWGGMIAPRVALAAPDRVGGLILFNTTAEAPTTGMCLIAVLLTWLLRFPVLDQTVDGMILSANLTERTRAQRPDLAIDFIRRFRSWDRKRMIQTVRSVLVERDGALDRLHAITAPTLVISGGEDRTLPTPHSVRIAARIPGARHVEVPGCAHLVTVEAPDIANRLALEIAEQVRAIC